MYYQGFQTRGSKLTHLGYVDSTHRLESQTGTSLPNNNLTFHLYNKA